MPIPSETAVVIDPQTPATPVVEATPATPVVEATPTPDKAKERESSRWKQQLSREAKLLADREAIKAEREAIKADRAAAEAYQAAIKEAKSNPLKLLETAGITYDQLVTAYMSGGTPPPDLAVKALEDKLTAFQQAQKSEKESALKAQQDALQAEADRQIAEWRSSTITSVESSIEKYPMIAGLSLGSAVADEITAHYEQTGKVMTVDEAAPIVEGRVASTLPADLKRRLAIPGFRSLVKGIIAEIDGPSAKEPAPKQTKAAAEAPVVRRHTLSNAITASTPTAPAAPKSWEEFKREKLKR
jgi:hypothetical protein